VVYYVLVIMVVVFLVSWINLVLNVYFSLASCLYTVNYLYLALCLYTVVSSLFNFQGRCCRIFPFRLQLFIHNNLGGVFLVTSIVSRKWGVTEIALGASLAPLDTNQEGLPLRDAWNQKKKAISPTPQEVRGPRSRDQRSRGHPPTSGEKKRENASAFWTPEEDWWSCRRDVPYHARQRARTKATTERASLGKPMLWWLWYDDFNHGNFALDDASPLAAELQSTPWPPSYKPPKLPMYDGHSNPKQFLMSYGATISLYGGNTTVMAKSFVMAVRSVAQTWYSSHRRKQSRHGRS
jgi:hypothetical protein